MERDCASRGCPLLKNDKFDNIQEFNSDPLTKLTVYDWLHDVPPGTLNSDIVEVRFKNTRKGYYINANKLRLEKDDIIAVESNPGHDIGIISLTGDLVLHQIKKNNIDLEKTELKKVYRKAKPADIEKWALAIDNETTTMIKARKIAEDLKLEMKIGDVEYQGDNTKAIFYYIADDRVDFRELIKLFAEEFKIRIEMKQIGARQEAGRIGGIGPCGRELCCSTFITNFISVTTNAARFQDVSINPQKLAGQCGKLKCCLNYELPCYIDALQDFPDLSITIDTNDGTAYCIKRDIYRRILWFSYNQNNPVNLTPITVDKAKQFLEINKKGHKIESLSDDQFKAKKLIDYQNSVGEESLTRFDEQKRKKKNKKRRRK